MAPACWLAQSPELLLTSIHLMLFKFFAICFKKIQRENTLKNIIIRGHPEFLQASPNSLLSPLFSRENKPNPCSTTLGSWQPAPPATNPHNPMHFHFGNPDLHHNKCPF